MLMLSAGATFGIGDRLWAAARTGSVPVWVALFPVCAYTAFVVVYAIDRWLLIKRRNYPLGRALAQVIVVILFLALLWPHQAEELRATRRSPIVADRALRLLRDPDPQVRAAMCELLALRAQASASEQVAGLAETDRSEEVREACSAARDRLQALGDATPDPDAPTASPPDHDR
jgi:hypothetical protein